MSELLKVSGLWGGYKEGVDILRGIDMTVQEGEAVGIIGLNGSGKSTLGKAIMNMIPFRKGKIEFGGEDVTDLSTYELTRKGIAIMQQGGKVFQNLSVWENLEIAFASGMGDSFDRLQGFIPLLQYPKRKLRYQGADKLSGGQKHQLALALALATQPKLVILDEPSAGLSPKALEEMYVMLHSILEAYQVTVILIEQNITKAMFFCSRCMMIRSGKSVQEFVGEGLTISEIENLMFKE